jgi:hypothetical protein
MSQHHESPLQTAAAHGSQEGSTGLPATQRSCPQAAALPELDELALVELLVEELVLVELLVEDEVDDVLPDDVDVDEWDVVLPVEVDVVEELPELPCPPVPSLLVLDEDPVAAPVEDSPVLFPPRGSSESGPRIVPWAQAAARHAPRTSETRTRPA